MWPSMFQKLGDTPFESPARKLSNALSFVLVARGLDTFFRDILLFDDRARRQSQRSRDSAFTFRGIAAAARKR